MGIFSFLFGSSNDVVEEETTTISNVSIKGTLIVSTELTVTVYKGCQYPRPIRGYSDPYSTCLMHPRTLLTLDELNYQIFILLQDDWEYSHVYNDYIKHNLDSWKEQGWNVVFDT